VFKWLLGGFVKAFANFFVFNADWLLKTLEFLMNSESFAKGHTASIMKAREYIAKIEELEFETLRLDIYPKLVVAFMVSISAPVLILWKLSVDMSSDFFHFAGTCLMPIRTGLLFFPAQLLTPNFQKIREKTGENPMEKVVVESNNNAQGAAKAMNINTTKPIAVERTPLQKALKLQTLKKNSGTDTHHKTNKLTKHSSGINSKSKNKGLQN
jgi:hypothetical protein